MEKRWIGLTSVLVGLLCALGWYGAFALEYYVNGIKAKHIHWESVSIGAAICFVAGWGLIHFAARQPAPPKE